MGSEIYQDLPWLQDKQAFRHIASSDRAAYSITHPHLLLSAAGRVTFPTTVAFGKTYFTPKCLPLKSKPERFVRVPIEANDIKLPGLAKIWLDLSTITVLPTANENKYLYIAYLPPDSQLSRSLVVRSSAGPKIKTTDDVDVDANDGELSWIKQVRFHLVLVQNEIEFGTKHAHLLQLVPAGSTIILAGELETIFTNERHEIHFNDSSGTLSDQAPTMTGQALSHSNPHALNLKPYERDMFEAAMKQSPALRSIYGKYVASIHPDESIERLNVWSVDLLSHVMRQFVFGSSYPLCNKWSLEYRPVIVFAKYDDAYIASLCRFPSVEADMMTYDSESSCQKDDGFNEHTFDEASEWADILARERADTNSGLRAKMSLSRRFHAERAMIDKKEERARLIAAGELDPNTYQPREDGLTDEQVVENARAIFNKMKRTHQLTIQQQAPFCPRAAAAVAAKLALWEQQEQQQ